mgnify:FL=1
MTTFKTIDKIKEATLDELLNVKEMDSKSAQSVYEYFRRIAMFKLNRKNGVSYYTITSFEETGLVKHGFSTREGGVSDGCYSSMNFRFHCDDTQRNVLKL